MNGTVKILGGEQRLRTPTLTWDRPERREEQEILQGQEDSTRDEQEAKSDFWSITGEFISRHHVVPRVKLYVPREETFPIPLKYIDVATTTCTSLDILLGKILKITGTWMVNKNCQMHGQASQDSFN